MEKSLPKAKDWLEFEPESSTSFTLHETVIMNKKTIDESVFNKQHPFLLKLHIPGIRNNLCLVKFFIFLKNRLPITIQI